MRAKRLPAGTVDFHTHILPGADHGSRNLTTSCRQWQLLCDAGASAVVATPHVYAHEEASVEAFLSRRDHAARELLSAVGEGGPALYLGAEVLVFPGLEALPSLGELCIGGTNLLLLEMPLGGWSQEHVDTLGAIADRGMIPLLAHLDRYPLRLLNSLYEHPSFLFQVNVSSILGLSARAFYFRRMLKAGAVAALGSDLHGLPREGYERYLRAFLRAGESLKTVNRHTDHLLSTAEPYRL